MFRCSTCNVFYMQQFLQFSLFFSMIWYCRVQSPAVSKRQVIRWWNFRWLITLSTGYVFDSGIDRVIPTPSCSLSIRNRYCQIDRHILPNFLFFCMIWYDWIQSPAMSKRQDVRWCSFRWSIPLSIHYVWESSTDRVISTSSCLYRIYEINTSKIIAAFCRNSYCLHDLIRLNSIVCHIQTTRCTMI